MPAAQGASQEQGERPYAALLGANQEQSVIASGYRGSPFQQSRTFSSVPDSSQQVVIDNPQGLIPSTPATVMSSPGYRNRTPGGGRRRAPSCSPQTSEVYSVVSVSDQLAMYKTTKEELIEDGVKLKEVLNYTTDGRLRGVTQHYYFSQTIYLFIVLSALSLAVETDYGDPSGVVHIYENVACFVFLVEAICKIVDVDFRYFQDTWNLFDFGLAIYSVLDLWILGSGAMNLSFLRVLRIVRIGRMVKLLRMCKELWLLLSGMANSIIVIMWTVVLLFFVTFTASIVVTKVIGKDRENYAFDDSDDVGAVATEWNNYEHFGSIPRSMVTMFNMGTGMEWGEIVRPVLERQPYMIPFFILFLAIVSWGVMNAIIGVVVEGMMEAVNEQQVERQAKKRSKKECLLDQLLASAIDLDLDHGGEIDPEEMARFFDDPAFKAVIGQMRVFRTAEDFIALFDRGDGNGKLTYNEFIRGMYNWMDSPGDWKFCELKIGEQALKSMVRRGFDEVKNKLDSMQKKEAAVVSPAEPAASSSPPAWAASFASLPSTLATLQGSVDALSANMRDVQKDTVEMQQDLASLKRGFEKIKRKHEKGSTAAPPQQLAEGATSVS